jgi:hypothetical protein
MSSEPTEEELRAYEEELSQITSTQLVVQASASLLNVGGRRLGLAEGAERERDLEQVRDAIDAVRALLPILERRMPGAQAAPLRDALSQLQMAYARLAQSEVAGQAAVQQPGEPRKPSASEPPRPTAGQPPRSTPDPQDQPAEDGDPASGPGPAERSGRLWVPGR